VSVKSAVRTILPRSIYNAIASRYQAVRRLYGYPARADLRRHDYDAYWVEKSGGRLGHLSEWRRRRAEAFAAFLETGQRVLDIGTGDGAVLEHLIRNRGIVAKGLDISPAAVAFCRGKGLDVECVDLEKLNGSVPPGPWDYVIASEILEHLSRPEDLIEALRTAARIGLLVSIPNSGYVAHRFRLALGRFPLQWIVFPGEHLRFWTVSDFEWWASQLGFTISARVPYEGVRFLKDIWPSLFAAGMVYELRRQTPP
jgi:methionine biosynthesis protein MetW